jgi:hypothetical protein
MVPVAREQLEQVHVALQLYELAGVAEPEAFLMTRLLRPMMETIRSHYIPEIEDFYQNIKGMTLGQSRDIVRTCEVTEAAIRLPLTLATLGPFMGSSGLLVDRAPAILRITTGDSLTVLLHSGVGLTICWNNITALNMSSRRVSLESYLQRTRDVLV